MPLPDEFWSRLKAAEKKLPNGAVGYKNDEEKLRYDLIPPSLLESLAAVLTFGAKKYADRNWEKGMAWGRVFGALMRHMWAWWRGEAADPDTGLSHLAHAAFCIAALIEYETTSMMEHDDRPSTRAALSWIGALKQEQAQAQEAQEIAGMTGPKAAHDPAKYAERRCDCGLCRTV